MGRNNLKPRRGQYKTNVMTRWSDRFLSSTRGQVIRLLRRGRASVSDLAGVLQLTDNAVRSHLSTLERDRLVRPAGKRPGTRRPEVLYELTPEADHLFPHAYDQLFGRMLDALERRLAPQELEEVLREVGASLAAPRDVRASASLRERADEALAVLKEMGGLAELDERDDLYRIKGYSCPLASVVEHHPQVCRLAQSLLEGVMQVPVREQCERNGTPRCAFIVSKS